MAEEARQQNRAQGRDVPPRPGGDRTDPQGRDGTAAGRGGCLRQKCGGDGRSGAIFRSLTGLYWLVPLLSVSTTTDVLFSRQTIVLKLRRCDWRDVQDRILAFRTY